MRIDQEITENQQIEISDLKDIFIIGLDANSLKKDQVSKDALKALRIQYNVRDDKPKAKRNGEGALDK